MFVNPKKGDFFPLDKNGNILNPTHIDLIAPFLLPLLDTIIQLYKDNEGQNLHSIWLRGSTPRGFFTEKYSDIDVFALVNTPGIRWQKADWATNAEEILKESFDDLPEIEWAVSSWYSDFYVVNSYLSFHLKTQSLLLFGNDIRPTLPNFKVTDDIKINLSWLQEDVETFMDLENPTQSQIQTTLKVVIRSAYESIIEQEGRYTPDLYWCAEAFGRHCIEGREPIFELLEAFGTQNNDILSLKENIKKVNILITRV